MSDVLIATYAHCYDPIYIPRCLNALWESTRYSNYSITLQCHIEDRSAHANAADILEFAQMSGCDYLVIVDYDVAHIRHGWLDDDIRYIENHPDTAIVGHFVIKRDAYIDRGWVPGMVQVLNLSDHDENQFMPQFDVDLPGRKCMTDVDICVQAIASGMRVVENGHYPCVHPLREEWGVADYVARNIPLPATCDRWMKEQQVYMKKKWGAMLDKVWGLGWPSYEDGKVWVP